jgi:hypothetical protein
VRNGPGILQRKNNMGQAFTGVKAIYSALQNNFALHKATGYMPQ